MNPKLLLCLALVLSGGLFGCSSVHERPAAMSNAAGAEAYISEIHMIDTRNGWAWSGGIEGSNLLLHTSDGGRTWHDRTPRAFRYDEPRQLLSRFANSLGAHARPEDLRWRFAAHTDGGKSWSV